MTGEELGRLALERCELKAGPVPYAKIGETLVEVVRENDPDLFERMRKAVEGIKR